MKSNEFIKFQGSPHVQRFHCNEGAQGKVFQ